MSLPGVRFLDHTADVGMDIDAASLDELLHRAALGLLALLRGDDDDADDGPAPGARGPDEVLDAAPLELQADAPPALLADWLRELLFLHEVERRDYVGFDADVLGPTAFRGVVRARPGGHAVREIKGVTYHGLNVEERDGRWRARVIFDV